MEKRKIIMVYSIMVVVMSVVIGGVIWLYKYSGYSKNRPIEILEEFGFILIDYEVNAGGFLTQGIYTLRGDEHNLIVKNDILSYDLEILDLNMLKKGELIKCKRIKKGWTEKYVCGPIEYNIPQDIDLCEYEKMVVLMMCVLTSMLLMGTGKR